MIKSEREAIEARDHDLLRPERGRIKAQKRKRSSVIEMQRKQIFILPVGQKDALVVVSTWDRQTWSAWPTGHDYCLPDVVRDRFLQFRLGVLVSERRLQGPPVGGRERGPGVASKQISRSQTLLRRRFEALDAPSKLSADVDLPEQSDTPVLGTLNELIEHVEQLPRLTNIRPRSDST